MNILITSAGQRVSLVRAFQRELKKVFPNGKVFTTDMLPSLSAACSISDRYFQVSSVTHENYVDELIKLCSAYYIKMIIPTIDTELLVLSKNKIVFEQNDIAVIISEQNLVEQCRDKRKINSFFTKHRMQIPRQYEKESFNFPLFIKPYDGSLSADIYLINKYEELTEYHLTNEKFMFMEYINNKEHDEFTVDMYYDKNNVLKCVVPRKRIVVRAGEVNKGITRKNVIVAYLKERLYKMEGAVGCITLQLFLHRTNNRIIAIEINPRFGGGYPLSYQAGANFPSWLIKEYFLTEDIPYVEDWEDNLLMLRYDDEILVHDYNG